MGSAGFFQIAVRVGGSEILLWVGGGGIFLPGEGSLRSDLGNLNLKAKSSFL